MKRYFPGRVELGFLLGMALVCALIVQCSPSRDFALAALGAPVFLIASLMGLRRSGALAPIEEDEDNAVG